MKVIRYVCFKCGGEFTPLVTCGKCGWAKCPDCESCLCSLTDSEKIVAISVWFSHG
jgi:hypothetical protein